jgi:hypothetical protein
MRLSRNVVVVLVLITAIAAVAFGYFAGRYVPPAGAVAHIGVVGASENAMSVEADGWTYNIPTDIAWIDAGGAGHDSGRPGCLQLMLETSRSDSSALTPA